MQLGKRLAIRLKELGLTQRQVADKSGLTQPAISKYIRNQTKPSYQAIAKLSRILEVHPGWFFPEHETEGASPQRASTGLSRQPGGEMIVFPKSGKRPQSSTFVIGHWLPMQNLPSPLQVGSDGIVKHFYSLIFSTLTQWVFYGHPRGALAIDWKQLEDRWVFQLREGVRFHDGTPLKMTDVMWSYEQYLRHAPSTEQIEAVEVIDQSFLQLRLKSPSRLEQVPMPFILPEGAADWVGTGPFEVIELNPGFWRLRKNRQFFFHQPFFEEVHVRQFESPEALESALASGAVHFAVGINRPGDGFTVKTEADALRYHLSFALNEPLAQNPKLRKAIAMGLDREALARAAGLKMPLYSSGPFDYVLRNREEKPAPPDVEMARLLMNQVEDLQNTTFRVKAFPTVPQSRALAEAIVSQLQALGMKAEVGEPAHASIVIRPVGQLDYEYAMWTSGDRRNINGYDNPAVDEQIRKLRRGSATNADLLELRGLIQQDMPDIALFYYETPITYVSRLRALENHIILLAGLNDIHNWYVEESERQGRRNHGSEVLAQAG